MAGGPAVAAIPARGGPLGGTVGASASANASLMATLSPEERHELEQYEKILRFRDEVVSGTHPRIKPTHVGKPTNGTGPVPPANASAASAGQAPGGAKPAVNGNRSMTDNFQAYQANLKKPAVNPGGNVPGSGTLSNTSSEQSKPKVEINPILLEKSDDLIKAEIQLQRQRIERSLREDIEQRRVSQKGALQPSEQPADFDIADVLAKALILVQANAAQTTDDTVANASASGDSFDDNTFYSSQHGTPDSHYQLARVPNESEDEQMRDGSPYEPELDLEPVAAPTDRPKPPLPTAPAAATNLSSANAQLQQVHSASSSASSVRQPFNVNVPGASSAATSVSRAARQFPPSEAVSSRDSGPASRSEESTHTGKERGGGSRDLTRVNEQLLKQALGPEGGSPVVRAHNLSPFAPQPSRVSPLPSAALEQPISLSETGGRRATPPPAQGVAALRKQPSAVSSPESSPHGGERPGERKNKKKKKRKADRLAEAAASPYIKPEPRSPSPMSAPQYTRPAKRQKQGQQQQAPDYDDARYGQPGSVEGAYQERLQPRVQREERVVGYEREIDPRPRLEGEPLLATPRYERVYYDDPRAPLSGGRLPGSPGMHASPYGPREVRVPPRNVIYDVPPPDDGYYRDVRAASRMSMRPTPYRERSSRSPVAYERVAQPMAPPPRVPATRIVVDAFGREYIEPPRPQSVLAERPEIVYARPPPPRAVTRRPEGYDDEVMVYESTSPAGYAPQRRVIAQPEYVTPEHRVYRERAYSTHPMGPPSGDYVPSRLRVEGRPVVEMPQEYIARPGSVRPPMDTRYESVAAYDLRTVDERPREYYGGRAASVRPVAEAQVRYEQAPPPSYERRMAGEPSLREYATIRSASVRPPMDAPRYEIRGDYGARMGSVQPEMAGRDYQGRQEIRREVMQPPPPPMGGRAYSVFPPEQQPPQQVMRGDGGAYGDERYYAQRPPVQQQEDDEVVYLDRPPMRDAYRQ